MKTLAKSYCEEKSIGQVAEIFDYAVNVCDIDGDKVWEYFVVTNYAKQFENNNPKFVLGKSSIEIVTEILKKIRNADVPEKEYISFDRTPEYWAGWILSQYQIYSELSFKKIHSLISFERLVRMYHPYHGAPPEKTFEILDNQLNKKESGLKVQREQMGLSQSGLAKKTGISIKTIQAYEQRLKSMKHARLETLENLSEELACEIEDLY